MALQIHPMTEDDFDDFARIFHCAFQGGMMDVLEVNSMDPEALARTRDNHLKTFRTNPHAHYLKVVDPAVGETVGVGFWEIYKERRPQEEFLKDTAPVPAPPSRNKDAWDTFFNYLTDARRNVMGPGPVAFLHILATDPNHHRRGAGALVMRWGVERADQLGLPGFIESTAKGKGLYEKWGFKGVQTTTFDLTKWGGEGTDVMTLMVRDPQPAAAASSAA